MSTTFYLWIVGNSRKKISVTTISEINCIGMAKWHKVLARHKWYRWKNTNRYDRICNHLRHRYNHNKIKIGDKGLNPQIGDLIINFKNRFCHLPSNYHSNWIGLVWQSHMCIGINSIKQSLKCEHFKFALCTNWLCKLVLHSKNCDTSNFEAL